MANESAHRQEEPEERERNMTANPYPKVIDCDSTGQSVGNPLYTAWQAGWDAGYWDCMSVPVATLVATPLNKNPDPLE